VHPRINQEEVERPRADNLVGDMNVVVPANLVFGASGMQPIMDRGVR